jgi:hypothetical protein
MLRILASRRATTLSAVALGVGAVAIGAPAAHAGALTLNACPADSALSQPFAAWGDTNEYRLLQGGDFAAGAPGWTLSGGATITGTGEPFGLAGGPSQNSLSLPAGATAQSPYTCVDLTQPTFRLVDAAEAPASLVAVSVVYRSGSAPFRCRSARSPAPAAGSPRPSSAMGRRSPVCCRAAPPRWRSASPH